MKKQKHLLALSGLFTGFLLVFLFASFPYKTDAGTFHIGDCYEEQGLSVHEGWNEQDEMSKSEYYKRVVEAFKCYRGEQWAYSKKLGGLYHSFLHYRYSSIRELIEEADFDEEECFDKSNKRCLLTEEYNQYRDLCDPLLKSKGRTAFDECMTPFMIKQGNCHNEGSIACEEELFSKIPSFIQENERKQKTSEPALKKKEVDPNDPRFYFCRSSSWAKAEVIEEGGFVSIANVQLDSDYTNVEHIRGEVLVKRKGESDWTQAYTGQRLMIGDEVKTGINGSCELRFANSARFKMKSISKLDIPEQEEPTFCELDFRGTAKWLMGTKFRADAVRKWREEQRELMRIKTNTAILGTRDTAEGIRGMLDNKSKTFSIFPTIVHASEGSIVVYIKDEKDSEKSEFYVEEGNIAISDLNENSTISVSAGEYISLRKGDVPEESDIVSASQIENKWWNEFSEGISLWVYLFNILLIIGVFWYWRKRRNLKNFKKSL